MAIYQAGAEDFQKMRQIVQKAIRTPYQCGWQFRVEIEGMPADFDLYVSDVSHGPTELELEELQLGSTKISFVTGAAPVDISMTMRENAEDGRISKWFDKWANKAVNFDGTVNLPSSYIKKFKRYRLTATGTETLADTWDVIPVKRGDVTESRKEAGALEFPVTLKQFRSLGKALAERQ